MFLPPHSANSQPTPLLWIAPPSCLKRERNYQPAVSYAKAILRSGYGMTVVQFPLVPVEEFVRGDRLPVIRDAVSRIDRLVSFYAEGCGRNPTTILLMIAAIMDESEFRKAAGIETKQN